MAGGTGCHDAGASGGQAEVIVGRVKQGRASTGCRERRLGRRVAMGGGRRRVRPLQWTRGVRRERWTDRLQHHDAALHGGGKVRCLRIQARQRKAQQGQFVRVIRADPCAPDGTRAGL
jgi:hypothetical protein